MYDLYDSTYGNSSQQQWRSRSGSHLSLLHVLHPIPLQAIRGWPIHYPGLHHYRNGEVLSDSATINATKFTGPHKSRMHQYCLKHAHRGQNGVVINRLTWGLPTSEFKMGKHTTLHPFHPVFSTFPKLPRPIPIQGNFPFIKRKPIIESPSWEGALSWVVPATCPLPPTSLLSITRVTWKEVIMQIRVSSNSYT
jgi:hypothetical protein